MDKIFRYILILLLFNNLTLSGQSKKGLWRYEGPRFGIDVSRFLMPYIHQGVQGGFELQADFPYKGNYFPTVEAGYMRVDDVRDKFHYTNKGPYARIGIDVNIKNFEHLTDHDLVFVGARYGFSRFTQATPEVTYSNYWGNINTAFPSTGMSAHWAELVFGLKGELLPNLFFGWTARAKFKITSTANTTVTPYVIPGLGYTTSEVPFDFSVTVAYRLPLRRTNIMPKQIKMGGSKDRDKDQEEDPNDPNNFNNNRNGNMRSGFGGSGMPRMGGMQ